MKSKTKRLLREFNIKAERLREYREDMNCLLYTSDAADE